MSKRNAVLEALTSVIAAALPGATVRRNEVLPEIVPAAGFATVRDGDPGDPEATLSPLAYHWDHRAVVEIIVVGNSAPVRDAAMDQKLTAIGARLSADRTLGGLCDWVRPLAPQIETLGTEGAAPLLGCTLTIALTYSSADALA